MHDLIPTTHSHRVYDPSVQRMCASNAKHEKKMFLLIFISLVNLLLVESYIRMDMEELDGVWPLVVLGMLLCLSSRRYLTCRLTKLRLTLRKHVHASTEDTSPRLLTTFN